MALLKNFISVDKNTEDKQVVNLQKSSDYYVYGYITWEDSYRNINPLRNVKVDLYDEDISYDDFLGSTYTDDNGYFIIYYDNQLDIFETGCDLLLYVYPENDNYKVFDENDNSYFYKKFLKSNNKTKAYNFEGTIYNFEYPIKAFQVGQAINIAAKYAEKMSESDMPYLKIVFDRNNGYGYDYTASCGYYFVDEYIYIPDASPYLPSDLPYAYESWDTIFHEYGHFVQDNFNFNYPVKPMSHSLWGNLFDKYYTEGTTKGSAKEQATYISWGESWPTFFSILAQKYYANLTPNNVYISDNSYDSYNRASFDFDYGEIWDKGEFVESFQIKVLWEIFKNAGDNGDDNHKLLWNLVVNNKVTTFSQFINIIYEEYSYDDMLITLVSDLLFDMDILSSDIVVDMIDENYSPTFFWEPNGGTSYLENDRFDLIFFDGNHNELLRVNNIYSNNYTLSAEQWVTIQYHRRSYFYVQINSYQTINPVSGGYLSKKQIFNKPEYKDKDISLQIDEYERYLEEDILLFQTQNININICFESEYQILIQTFGSLDTVMRIYDDNDELIYYDDDSGYNLNSWIYFQPQSNINYTVVINLYDDYDFGKFRFSVTPAQQNIYDNNFSSLDDLGPLEIDEYYILESYMDLYGTYVIYFKVKDYGRYRIFTCGLPETGIENTFNDMVLYLIDPSSENSYIYSDDVIFDNQPSIFVDLDYNKEYIIVLSTYNFTYDEGDFCFCVQYYNI